MGFFWSYTLLLKLPVFMHILPIIKVCWQIGVKADYYVVYYEVNLHYY